MAEATIMYLERILRQLEAMDKKLERIATALESAAEEHPEPFDFSKAPLRAPWTIDAMEEGPSGDTTS